MTDTVSYETDTDAEVEAILADFDHHSPDFARRWVDVYRAARTRECPVIHSENHGGYDVITRHADVSAGFRNWQGLASERLLDEDDIEMEGGVGIPEHAFRIGFLEMDPPESLGLRRLCNPWFNQQTIDASRDRLGEIMAWAFDNVIETGRADVVTDLVSPFQCVAIMDLLGIPLEKWEPYKAVVDTEVSQEEGNLDGMQWLLADIFDETERQKVEGGSGLLAALLDSEVDGEPLDEELITELILMLLLGGMDTTIATVSHAVRHLHDNPDDRQRLSDDTGLIAPFVEEVLRFYSPATGMARTVREPLEIGGKSFQRGDRLYLAIGAANHDEAAFERADEFVIDRSPNPHMAFGTGTHRCIGLDLGRTNAQLFMAALLSRIPDFSVLTDEARLAPSIPHANGYLSLPISFTPGARVGSSQHSWPDFATPPLRPA